MTHKDIIKLLCKEFYKETKSVLLHPDKHINIPETIKKTYEEEEE